MLSEGDSRFFHERVLLTVCPTHAQRRVGTGGHVRLAPAVVTKVSTFPSSATGDPTRVLLCRGLFVHRVDEFHNATQSFRRQARRDPPGPTAVRIEGSKFYQKHTLVLRYGPGAHKRLHHGCIVVGDVVMEVVAFAYEGL